LATATASSAQPRAALQASIAAGTFATQSLGGHRLGVIGPQRDGVNLVTGVNHERGTDRSHRATADDRNLRHSVQAARRVTTPVQVGEIKTSPESPLPVLQISPSTRI
jgi:hypothetical protein